MEGERSSVKVPHPFFTDLQCGRPLRWLSIGVPLLSNSTVLPANPPATLNGPTPFQSPNTRWEFNLDKAGQLLDQAGGSGERRHPCQGRRRMQVVPDLRQPGGARRRRPL